MHINNLERYCLETWHRNWVIPGHRTSVISRHALIGTVLQSWRTANSVCHKELAGHLGYSPSKVVKIEEGITRISLPALEDLCKAIGELGTGLISDIAPSKLEKDIVVHENILTEAGGWTLEPDKTSKKNQFKGSLLRSLLFSLHMEKARPYDAL